jgi:hypothetical protein
MPTDDSVDPIWELTAFIFATYSGSNSAINLGSRLIDNQSQNKTVAARAMADRKTFGHLS